MLTEIKMKSKYFSVNSLFSNIGNILYILTETSKVGINSVRFIKGFLLVLGEYQGFPQKMCWQTSSLNHRKSCKYFVHCFFRKGKDNGEEFQFSLRHQVMFSAIKSSYFFCSLVYRKNYTQCQTKPLFVFSKWFLYALPWFFISLS